MAEYVLTDASVTINTVDLSDHVRQVTIDYSAETPESTAMGDTVKAKLPGLTDFKIELEFNQDYDSAKVNATLFPLAGAAAFAIAIRPDSAVVGADNPEFQGDVLLSSYNPLGGKVGEVATTKATFVGDGVLTRATA